MTDPLPVADPWFTCSEVENGIYVLTEPHVARLYRANLYLVKGTTHDLLVDTGMGIGDLRATIAPLVDKPLLLFTTHTHLDHIGGHSGFRDVEILIHHIEAPSLQAPDFPTGLSYAGFSETQRAAYRAAGFDTSGWLVNAVPSEGYDLDGYTVHGVEPTRLVGEGDVLDIGGRVFDVMHLPGHSPGGVALWEKKTGLFIAGDVIYDGLIIDTTPDASIPDYLATMERLRSLPVNLVLGGHREPFGRQRMLEIIDDYVESRTTGRAPPPPRASF
jgi:glyoxylase-like metal-dependent hydrolase (beta-lactamase superfamily II)